MKFTGNALLLSGLSLALMFGATGTRTALAQDNPPTRTDTRTEPNPMPVEDTIDPNQPIKPQFQISVSVVGEPDPSGTYTVDDGGNITIKYAGVLSTISVQNMTPKMAEGEIAKILKMYIKNPQITVKIASIPRPTVFIGGAVKNPGPTIVTQDATLFDVLSRAGYLETADLSKVRIVRKEKVNGEDKVRTITANIEEYIRPSSASTVPDESQNPILKDKDRVIVPSKVSQGNGVISVGGEVSKPQLNIPIRTSPAMTVREVVNLVGGTTSVANRKAITIRRPSIERPLVIDLDKAEQGDPVNNIELRPDDVIYVERLENNAYINVNGGFVKTGKFIYDKRTTLTQAVSEAGGPAPFAKIKDGQIYRHPDNDPKNSRVIPFNWEQISKGKSPDVELLPGDSVFISPGVPPAPRADVFSYLNGLSSLSFIYSNFTGARRF